MILDKVRAIFVRSKERVDRRIEERKIDIVCERLGMSRTEYDSMERMYGENSRPEEAFPELHGYSIGGF
jgi:hypothetical protein